MQKEEVDSHICPLVGDVVTGTIRPALWIRSMAGVAHLLWKVRLVAASWWLADACIWLQRRLQRS